SYKLSANDHSRKNRVVKAAGTEEHIDSDVKSLEWQVGDKLLLCSDGLTDKLTDEQIEDLIDKGDNMMEAGQQMVDLANELGGEDNISLVLVQHDGSEEGETSC